MQLGVQSPFELFPVEQLHPEGRAAHGLNRSGDEKATSKIKSAAESMSMAYRELSDKSGLAILSEAVALTGGNVVFGDQRQAQKPREQTRRGYHKETFYMAPVEQRAPSDGPLELDRKLKQAFNIVVVSSNIKYITKDFLVRHGFTLEVLIRRCKVSIEELRLARILDSFDDLLDMKFKARDLVLDRQLFNTDKLAALYNTYYEDLRACKRFSLTAFDLAECQFYPNELMAIEFSFDPMISKGYISKSQLAKLKFKLADVRMLGFTADHANLLGINERDARKLFKWDPAEFSDFCPSEESSDDDDDKSSSQ